MAGLAALVMPIRTPATTSTDSGAGKKLKRRLVECQAVLGARDAKRLAKPPRPRAEEPLIAHAAPPSHDRKSDCRLQSPDQDCAGRAFGLADEIEAPVNAVGAINVGVAWRAEHHGVTGGRPAITVRCGVGVVIGLEFDDPAADAVK